MHFSALIAAAATGDASILELLRESGPVGKSILALLFVLSVASWAMIVERLRTLRRADRETVEFLEKFRSSENLGDLSTFAGTLRGSPVVALFRAGFRELNRAAGRAPAAGRPSIEGRDAGTGPQQAAIDRRAVDGVQRMLQRCAHAELRQLERALTFLATVASVAPFIGLFGTVWGIMNAFRGIGASGQASIAASAPGIAEALITTAAGLAAAIPAVVAYNHFNRRVRTLATQMEEFATDFVHLVEQYVR
jgi:biopolymer transport protein TolQ